MERVRIPKGKMLLFLFAGMLAAAPAFADKGDRREHGAREGGGRAQHNLERREMRPDYDRREHFSDEQRVYLHQYYGGRFQRGNCPPGLLKKHNGCMPPGQARKWMIGRPLPPGLIFYDLPPGVLIQLGSPPHGYRYIRVAGDILLIAIGTGMVIDAIEDLGQEYR